MRQSRDWKIRILPVLALLLTAILITVSFSELLLPAAGKKQRARTG